MTPLQLRESLETILSDRLGTYRLGNGATTTAISVRAEGEPLPARTRVSGVEAIIRRDPGLRPVPSYINQNAFRVWFVDLLDWSNTGTLEEMATAVLAAYGNVAIADLPVSEGAGPQAHKRLTFSSNPEVR